MFRIDEIEAGPGGGCLERAWTFGSLISSGFRVLTQKKKNKNKNKKMR